MTFTTRLIVISIEYPDFTQCPAFFIGANLGGSASLEWSTESRIQWYTDFEADVNSADGKVSFVSKKKIGEADASDRYHSCIRTAIKHFPRDIALQVTLLMVKIM
jgi:hypothetical protein